MVNLVEAGQSLLHAILKLAGLRQQTIMIEPGTVMSFWAPKKTNSKHIKEKPAVILVHGFAADGIMTWLFQFGTLTSKYSVYIPDLLFFGGSTTNSNDRSPNFQAECLIKALDELGVEECTVVGFSYGGMVAFKMAEARPEIDEGFVVSDHDCDD
ncbi:uncharacterized protein A4U43_C05F12240 [Asparagus officinalis]|uniref:AB hydrolase-1 domain-containing protein n=1 Tax=Asparagus officinalis TaxID=4686 RepID=A0A5P1ETQ1_ASPOF|nr:uncharacterized protein A4U43_C05F12240 [Asparagus officinalis]